MNKFHDKQFPGESDTYREKRDELLGAEIELRRKAEEVARLRRELPEGGKIKGNYIFEENSDRETVRKINFSDLFQEGKDTLLVYSFMFAPDAEKPCPSCSSILDGLNGQARHFLDRVNFVAVAKAPVEKLSEWAEKKGWQNIRLLSSYNNSYNLDYYGESSGGKQWPILNVFQKKEEGIYHFYATELLFAQSDEGQNPRHVDMIWPLWNLFDLTPEGRGTDWYPKHSYNVE